MLDTEINIADIIADELWHNNFSITTTEDSFIINWDNWEIEVDKDKILSEYKKRIKIEELNNKRNKELKGFVIDNIFLTEDILKTMAVKYSISSDDELINWIWIDNEIIQLTIAELWELIKKGSDKIWEIYFKYRMLKDNI